MFKRRSTLPNPFASNANLASAIAQIGAEIDQIPLRSSALARFVRETFHGSDAGGAWDWRTAYDLMQAAAIQVLLCRDAAVGDIATAKLLASRLLRETRRSEQQIRLQPFFTPLTFSALVLRAAAIRKGETVLEPSAGTGALAAFAARAGATLLLNEIDPLRQSLLRAVFGGEVTGLIDSLKCRDIFFSPTSAIDTKSSSPETMIEDQYMPNWCYNELTVSGETADLKAFATAVAGSAGPMDFQAVLPMPPILHNVARGTWPGDDAGEPVSCWYERRGPDYALLERRRLTAAEEAELDALPCDNAYDWCCEFWGTKWNAVDATKCWTHDEQLCYGFDTAWSPPEGIVQTLRERFPQLHISAFYDEPMMEICGYY